MYFTEWYIFFTFMQPKNSNCICVSCGTLSGLPTNTLQLLQIQSRSEAKDLVWLFIIMASQSEVVFFIERQLLTFDKFFLEKNRQQIIDYKPGVNDPVAPCSFLTSVIHFLMEVTADWASSNGGSATTTKKNIKSQERQDK